MSHVYASTDIQMSWIMVQNLKDLVTQLLSQDILDINLDQKQMQNVYKQRPENVNSHSETFFRSE